MLPETAITFKLKSANLGIVLTQFSYCTHQAPVPTHCSAKSIILLIQGCEVEQATTIKTSFQFIPGLITHDPPGSIDDICLENTEGNYLVLLTIPLHPDLLKCLNFPV